MKLSLYVVIVIFVLLSGCSAVVPLESLDKDMQAKLFETEPNRSIIYVSRVCAYGGKLHEVSLDGGKRISLACQTYTVFKTTSGEHGVSVFSTENMDFLKVKTKENENYFLEMGWRMGSGTGDVKATIVQLTDKEGRERMMNSRLISTVGY